LRQYEGGNDDDPRDPGGRTSRGIIQREWNVFRKTHPGRPADVWKASETDITAIYHDGQYWAGQQCPALPAGVDASTADYGVNSGVGRSGKVLRHICGLPTTTYRITDEVVAAVSKRDPNAVIDAINNERLAFVRSLSTFGTFGRGWTSRISNVRAISHGYANKAATHMPPVPPVPADIGKPAKATHPEPKATKTVVKTAGGASAVTAGTLMTWIQAHPALSILIVLAVVGLAAWAIAAINAAHQKKNETPMPGTPVVPELGTINAILNPG
jgi:lysozyme family protein